MRKRVVWGERGGGVRGGGVRNGVVPKGYQRVCLFTSYTAADDDDEEDPKKGESKMLMKVGKALALALPLRYWWWLGWWLWYWWGWLLSWLLLLVVVLVSGLSVWPADDDLEGEVTCQRGGEVSEDKVRRG